MSAVVIKEMANVNKLKNITSKTASSGIINNEHILKQALFTFSVVWMKTLILDYPLLIDVEIFLIFIHLGFLVIFSISILGIRHDFWVSCHFVYLGTLS